MKWPLHNRPVPYREIPIYNRYYLQAPASSRGDPAMVMGTEVEAEALQAYLRERNRAGRILITTSHVLVRAMAMALMQFPEMNVRVVGHRLHAIRDVNVRMAFFHRQNNEIDILMIRGAGFKSLDQIAQEVWERLLQAGRGEGGRDRDLARMRRVPGFLLRQMYRVYNLLDRHFALPTLGRLDELRGGAATVNDLSYPGAPPMRSYKPTRFPDDSDSWNLTLGPAEDKVVERSGRFMTIRVMPLFVRADHRIADAYQVGQFLAAVRELFHHPERLDVVADEVTVPAADAPASVAAPGDPLGKPLPTMGLPGA